MVNYDFLVEKQVFDFSVPRKKANKINSCPVELET